MCEVTDLVQNNANQCPICQRHCGNKNPRHAMMSHIRRSAHPAHVVWRAKNWQLYFPHGKFRTTPRTQELLKAIEQEYGPQILQSLVDDIMKSRESSAWNSTVFLLLFFKLPQKWNEWSNSVSEWTISEISKSIWSISSFQNTFYFLLSFWEKINNNNSNNNKNESW